MVTRLDRYLLVSYIPALFICIFILIGIYVVVDLFQKFDDLLSHGDDALRMAFDYYTLFVPVMVANLFPPTVLIAAGFTLLRLSKNNEIMAMQVSGVSLKRILLPIFLTVFFFSLLAMANQELLIPALADKLERLRTITFDKSEIKEIFVEDYEKGFILRVARYDIIDETMRGIFIVGMDKGQNKMFTISAKEGKWVGEGTWYLSDVIRHDYEDGNWVPPIVTEKNLFLNTSIRPKDMRKEERDPHLLSMVGLLELSQKQPENPQYQVSFYSRTTYPFIPFVLLLLAIPFILGFEKLRKHIFLGIGCVIGVVCVFFVITVFCTSLGVTGHLHPVLAGWLPLLIFVLIGLLVFDWVGE